MSERDLVLNEVHPSPLVPEEDWTEIIEPKNRFFDLRLKEL